MFMTYQDDVFDAFKRHLLAGIQTLPSDYSVCQESRRTKAVVIEEFDLFIVILISC